MEQSMDRALRNKAINGWSLFRLITGPISALMVFSMMRADMGPTAIRGVLAKFGRWIMTTFDVSLYR